MEEENLEFEKGKYLLSMGNYIRETIIELNELIMGCDLPYELDCKFDIKHKNWKYVEKVHLR